MRDTKSTAIVRVVDGWSVTMDGDEPTILDEELGTRLGFARPRKIREVIERMISDGILNDSDIRPALGQNTGGRGRPATAYHLGETAAYLVCTRSNTKNAIAITRQIVKVFIAVRRGQLAAPQQVPVLSSSPLVGDSRVHRAEIAAWSQLAASRNGASVHRVHGQVRRQFRVSGIYQLPLVLYPQARELLESLALGRLLLPSKGRLLKSVPADPAQHVLPFPGARL